MIRFVPVARVRNIVLVHGAWADGSGWKGVYDSLVRDGYDPLFRYFDFANIFFSSSLFAISRLRMASSSS